MEWIYLSPHFDDAALSCGGLIWEQANAGDRVSVWTICADDPPPGAVSSFASYKHDTWGMDSTSVEQRRQEDLVSSQIMRAQAHHFAIPDCIYRQELNTGRFLYDSEEALWGALHPDEIPLVKELTLDILQALPESSQVVAPMALGDHVDHHLTRTAAEALDQPLLYYADFPYILNIPNPDNFLQLKGWAGQVYPISEEGMKAWEDAVAAHDSQISTFWSSLSEMKTTLREYFEAIGGAALYKRYKND